MKIVLLLIIISLQVVANKTNYNYSSFFNAVKEQREYITLKLNDKNYFPDTLLAQRKLLELNNLLKSNELDSVKARELFDVIFLTSQRTEYLKYSIIKKREELIHWGSGFIEDEKLLLVLSMGMTSNELDFAYSAYKKIKKYARYDHLQNNSELLKTNLYLFLSNIKFANSYGFDKLTSFKDIYDLSLFFLLELNEKEVSGLPPKYAKFQKLKALVGDKESEDYFIKKLEKAENYKDIKKYSLILASINSDKAFKSLLEKLNTGVVIFEYDPTGQSQYFTSVRIEILKAISRTGRDCPYRDIVERIRKANYARCGIDMQLIIFNEIVKWAKQDYDVDIRIGADPKANIFVNNRLVPIEELID